jgi:hypothetical protein
MNSTVLVKPRIALVLALGILTAVLRAAGDEPDLAPEEPSATIQNRSIQLKPSGAEFQIPESWLKWHAEFKNNLHLSRRELEKVKNGAGEWDKEYAEIVNSVLPFSKCAAHVGDEGWGAQAVSWIDLQVRVYIVDMTPEQVVSKASKEGVAIASKRSKDVSMTASKQKEWRRATVSYSLWYGDYGGKAKIDFYARAFGKQTAVLVFMHARGDQPIDDIVESFKWDGEN